MAIFEEEKETRNVRINIRVTVEENLAIEKRIKQLGLKNKTDYIRKLMGQDIKSSEC